MISRFLKYTIRKEITRKNVKINHKSYTSSMYFNQKVLYLIKYHKKKCIASMLALLIIYTYDWQKSIYRKIMQMRSPIGWIYSFVVPQKKIPGTITEQSYIGSELDQRTIDILIQLYYEIDRQLYFGVGRNYLFNVFQDMELIEGPEQEKKFWQASGFYKQRNQKASGIGLTEFLNVFEEGLKFNRKSQPNLAQQIFLKKFLEKFISKLSEIRNWEKNFNQERMEQFVKNMPGDALKKQDAILDLVRDSTRKSDEPFNINEVEQQIVKMGMRGLNYADKYLYWELIRTWKIMKAHNFQRKTLHPLCTEMDKIKYNKDFDQIIKEIEDIQSQMQKIENTYRQLYKQQVI